MKQSELIMQMNAKLYEEDYEAFVKEDLPNLENNSSEIIKKVQENANELFSELSPVYAAICRKYELRQQEVLDLVKANYDIIVNSINLNSAYRKEMNNVDRTVLKTVVERIPMKTAFGKIVFEAILRCSQIQWERPVMCLESNFEFSDDQLIKLKMKLRKFFFESYTSGKSLKLGDGKNYKEAVSVATGLITKSCGRKIYEILLPNQIREWVKVNESAIKKALEFIPEKSAEVIRYYFGLDSIISYNFEKISAIIKKPEYKVASLFDDGVKKVKWKIRTQSELTDLF